MKLKNKMNTSLTVIIPAYNEEYGIKKILCDLLPLCEKYSWKVIVVNDGSTDNTAKELQDISGIIIINHPVNKGYGASLKTGIRAAKTDIIAFYDADGQHRPGDLSNMVQSFNCYDMLIGERTKDSHQEWIRKPGKWILAKTANYLTGRKIPDLNSGLRVIKKDVINKMLHLFPDGFSFSTTSTIAFMNLGYDVSYYPITGKKRIGKSSVKQVRDGSSVLLLLLRLIILFNPLKVFLPISVLFFMIGIGWGVYGFLFFGRFATTATVSIMLSMFLFFIGLIADQISIINRKISSR
jgi:glycosyltransferase involved in cell wall biosynthesis